MCGPGALPSTGVDQTHLLHLHWGSSLEELLHGCWQGWGYC